MNLITNGEYYLIANYRNNKFSVLQLNRNWFLKDGNDIFSKRNDISSIDMITTNFKSINELINFLYENGQLESKDVDLFIAHSKKYNGKKYLNESEIIIDNKEKEERMEFLKHMANARLYDEDTSSEEINKFFNKFVSKMKSKASFYYFMINPNSKVDNYIIEKSKHIFEPNYYFNNNEFKDKFSNYSVIRNIISMWNLYDELLLNHKGVNERQTGYDLTHEYLLLNRINRREFIHEEALKQIDNNYIEGQISIDDYCNKKDEPEGPVDYLSLKHIELKARPFNNPEIEKIYQKYGAEGVVKNFSPNSFTLEEQFKLGLFDIVEYFNRKEKAKVESKK